MLLIWCDVTDCPIEQVVCIAATGQVFETMLLMGFSCVAKRNINPLRIKQFYSNSELTAAVSSHTQWYDFVITSVIISYLPLEGSSSSSSNAKTQLQVVVPTDKIKLIAKFGAEAIDDKSDPSHQCLKKWRLSSSSAGEARVWMWTGMEVNWRWSERERERVCACMCVRACVCARANACVRVSERETERGK